MGSPKTTKAGRASKTNKKLPSLLPLLLDGGLAPNRLWWFQDGKQLENAPGLNSALWFYALAGKWPNERAAPYPGAADREFTLDSIDGTELRLPLARKCYSFKSSMPVTEDRAVVLVREGGIDLFVTFKPADYEGVTELVSLNANAPTGDMSAGQNANDNYWYRNLPESLGYTQTVAPDDYQPFEIFLRHCTSGKNLSPTIKRCAHLDVRPFLLVGEQQLNYLNAPLDVRQTIRLAYVLSVLDARLRRYAAKLPVFILLEQGASPVIDQLDVVMSFDSFPDCVVINT